MMWFLKYIIFLSLSINVWCDEKAEKEFTVELTSDSFDKAIQENNYFVMFFAPWCGHCKRLHPLWEQLAELMNVKEDPRVIIAKVDCTQYQEVCSKNEITGYPTLRFFKLGATESKKFQGTRDLPAITDFIQEQLGEKDTKSKDDSSESKVSTAEATELTDETFTNHISKGKHFVKFYAPWCSHCQRLAPTWQELADTLKDKKEVKISKIDCTQYRPICQDYEVKGYPTLLWFDEGKKIEKYSGSRNIDDFIAYIQNMSVRSIETTEDEEPVKTSDKPVIILNSEQFNAEIQNGVVFVKFYAPWCGHCKKLSPVWDELAGKLSGKSEIKIAKVDCTTDENRDLCQDQQVEGYPTLFIYKNGEKLTEYNGARQLDDLYSFVGRHVDGDHDEL